MGPLLKNAVHTRLRSVPEVATSLEEYDDDGLMALCQAGHATAFQSLIARHESYTFGLAAKYLGDRNLAEEVCQEVFVRVWGARHRYKPQGHFTSFLGAFCVNVCRETERKKWRQQWFFGRMAEESVDQENRDPEEVILRQEHEKRIERAIAALPRRHKEAVVLRFWGELPYREMSNLLKQSEATLRSRVFYALKRLRRTLREAAP